MDFFGHFHLSTSFEETKPDNAAFPRSQMLHGFGERQISDPVVFLVFLVTDLIHDIEGITAFCVDRIVKADRALDGVQGIDNVLFGNSDFLCNFTEMAITTMMRCIGT